MTFFANMTPIIEDYAKGERHQVVLLMQITILQNRIRISRI